MSSVLRLFLATLAVAFLVPLSALAVEPESAGAAARTLFELGVKLAGEERWAEAEHAFAESEALVPRASTAYDRALALYRLGRLREMLVELDRFVSWSDPARDADDRAAAERLRQSAESTLGTLRVAVTPPGASVEVDRDVLNGEGERLLRLDPGEHGIVARHEGFREARRTVRIAAGEHARVEIALEAAPVLSTPGAAPPPRSSADPGRRERPRSGPERSYRVPITLAVLGGVTLAGALVTGLVARNLDGQIAARCRGSDCPANLSDDQSRMWALATTSDGLLIAGGALVGASVTVWLVAPKSGATETGLSLSPTGARLGGTF